MKKTERSALVAKLIAGIVCLSFVMAGQQEGQHSYVSMIGPRALHFAIQNVQQVPLENADQNWSRFEIPGGGISSTPGQPELPSVTSWIAIDPSRHYSPEITLGEPEEIQDVHLPVYQSEDDPQNFANPVDSQPDLVSISDPVVMRNLVVVGVTITPVRYYPEEGRAEVYHSIDVSLVDDGLSEATVYTPQKLSEAFEPLYESLVSNFDRGVFPDGFQEPSILYILPSNASAVLPVLQPLLDWRKRSGYHVAYASTSTIGSSGSSIKNYIQDQYQNSDYPPEFVVLVGDASGSYSIPTWHETYSYYNGAGDQPYAELSGADHFPEVFIGRISFASTTELATIVNKTVQYESNPYMGGENWFSRALLVGDPGSSGISTIITNEYIRERLEFHGGSDIRTVYSSPFSSQMVSNLNDGVGFFNYRGWLGTSGFSSSNVNGLTNGFMLPFATPITCGTGTFDSGTSLTESLVRAGTPSVPKGSVIAIGTATTGTHTQFNNAVDMGIYYGLLDDGLDFAGAALARGKINLAQDYPSNPGNYVDIFTHWNNLIGDPALRVWKHFPQLMSVDHVYTVSEGTNFFDVTVLSQHGAIENALVTLWKSDDNSLFAVEHTDANGYASFNLDTVSTGEVYVTAVYQDYKPYQGSFMVVSQDKNVNILPNAVVIDDDSTGASLGNGDGIFTGGETVEISVPFKNYGTLADSGLYAVLSTTNDDVNVLMDTVYIGIMDSGDVSLADSPFVVSANPGLDGGTPLNLRVSVSDMIGNTWDGDLDMTASGCRLEVKDMAILDLSNGELDPGETAGVEFTLMNQGTLPATGVMGVLLCSSPSITVDTEAGSWEDIQPGQEINNAGNLFTVTADDGILPGTTFPCFLIVTTAEGNNKSFYLNLKVGTPSDGDPYGPDNYGYYIYDSGDQMYTSVPTYDWVEINSSLGGPGENLLISDTGNNQDDIKLVQLPFSFTFYGISYDMITVCSNGWISMGETTLKSFRNYPVPGGGGPSPMIAAFWDDLVTTSTGKIYTYHDEPGHRFIIEWSNVHTYQNGDNEDFQVILRDPEYYTTPTGDGEVKIQYKDFNNTSSNTGSAQTHGNYCTIGIEDQTAEDGLQYTYNNGYPPAAMQLSDETAILITTRGGTTRVYGDVNQDDGLDIYDLLLLANYLHDGDTSMLQPFMADINSDGQVNMIDLIVMFQSILNEN